MHRIDGTALEDDVAFEIYRRSMQTECVVEKQLRGARKKLRFAGHFAPKMLRSASQMQTLLRTLPRSREQDPPWLPHWGKAQPNSTTR